MVFNSISFALFLPIIFLLFWSIPSGKIRARNLLLLTGSYFFYACWDWRFLGLILLSSIVDYYVGERLSTTSDEKKRKQWLYLSVGLNIGLLGVFKYFNFFAESFADLISVFGWEAHWTTLNILLPIGISFYTFQTLSYTIDIYRKEIEAEKDWINFFTFVAFFPQLVAGPIERASNMLPQFRSARRFDYEQVLGGCRLILWGLIKKVVIADNLAYPVDHFYANPAVYTSPEAWIAILAFSIQIYGDFSGYSDIAIGTGRLFGFRLMDNFKTPLLSGSLREFWSRWHISLMNWFRDYIYFPLGGSRKGWKFRVRNILLVFFISGIWHGANWTFIVFGLIHGVAYLFEAFILKKLKYYDGLPGWFYNFSVWVFSLIFFRSADISQAFIVFKTLFANSVERLSDFKLFFPHIHIAYYTLVSILIMFILDLLIRKKEINIIFHKESKVFNWVLGVLMVLWFIFLGRFDIAPQFYYFQF